MERFVESPFKIVLVESKEGIATIVKVKTVFTVIIDSNGNQILKPKERVWKILKGKLENFIEVLSN